MKVQVKSKSGLVYSVVVRWSNAINGLYTTKGVLAGCTGGQLELSDIFCASAPFTVYVGGWNDYGFTEPPEYYDEKNVAGRVAFGDMNWNFQ